MFLSLFFRAFSTIVILCSMFIMMVVMINILIAQLGNSYGAVQKDARNEFSVAKALFIAKLDNSFFRFWVSSEGKGGGIEDRLAHFFH